MRSYHNCTLTKSYKNRAHFIDLRSDTVTLPSKEMIKFASDSLLGDDVYSEDPTVIELQSLAAKMFHKDSALFFPSGTQSNLTSIISHCNRGDEVLVGREYHSYSHEAHGASVLGGVALTPIETNQNDEISVESILNEIKPEDSHYAKTRLLCIENTVSGKAQNQENIDKLCIAAHENGLKVHLDGARIFNAHIHSGLPLDKLTKNVDSVSICLSKGLGSPIGSILIGNSEFIKKAKRNRKLLGGGMRQVGVIAGYGLYALKNNIERLINDHKNAKKLADSLSLIPELKVNYTNTQTNMVFIKFSELLQKDLISYLFNNNINISTISGESRLVCHLDVSSKQIDQVVEHFNIFFNK